MAALKLTITKAGRAALVNADANGTNAVVISQVAIANAAFTQDPTLTAMPNEQKRVSTIKGGATDGVTMHVTMLDDTTDTYSMYGIGLYLDNGTLFAVYSQAGLMAQKATASNLLVAADVQFADINAAQITFGDTNFQLNQGTAQRVGVLQLAIDSEAIDGTDTAKAVTSANVKAVLDNRFGAGAPTELAKTLLAVSVASEFRADLQILSAALYNIGAGNGLDADKLDGQEGAYYQAWENLTGVPTSFPPSAHPHSADDITSGTLPVVRGGTGANSFTAGNYLVGNGTSAVGEKTPADVLTDIGAAAKTHTHAIGDVNGLQDALDAKAPLASPAMKGTPTINGNYILQSNSGNVIYLGWQKYTAGKVGLTVDTTQIGDIATEAWSKSTFPVLGVRSTSFGTTLQSGAPPDMADISSSGNGNNVALTIANDSNTSASAVMAFLRDGQFGAFFGLDTDNQLKVGGWSFGSNSYAIFHEGRLPSKGNIVSSLGFNPVQQGTGVDQGSNIIAIGHSSDGPRLTVDATDFGPICFKNNFSSSRSSNGWVKLPDGTVIQWGVYARGGAAADGQTGSISFPMSFPNACLSVTATSRASSGGSTSNNDTPFIFGLTSSSFSWLAKAVSSGDWWEGMYWMAIGY